MKTTLSCREAWLVVASGGWWRQSEIISFLSEQSRVPDLHVRLRTMHRKGYLVRREIPKEKQERVHSTGAAERMEYAVTSECKVPQGLTCGAITRAMTGKAME